MPEVLEFNPESQYKLRLTDGGDWAPTEITSGAVHQAKNLRYSVTPEWHGEAPESAEGVTVEPLSDGSWGVFKGGEQIGAMSDKDVKPLDKASVPSGAPEPKAAPAAPATAPSAAKDAGNQDGDAPRRAASIGPDADGDGWVDGKEPLEPGSVDMPPLISGRNIDKALKDFDPKEPGAGLHQLGGTEFLPLTGDFEADEQIRSYEDSHLKNVNQLLDAPASSFMEGPILHNLAATEDAGKRLRRGSPTRAAPSKSSTVRASVIPRWTSA